MKKIANDNSINLVNFMSYIESHPMIDLTPTPMIEYYVEIYEINEQTGEIAKQPKMFSAYDYFPEAFKDYLEFYATSKANKQSAKFEINMVINEDRCKVLVVDFLIGGF